MALASRVALAVAWCACANGASDDPASTSQPSGPRATGPATLPSPPRIERKTITLRQPGAAPRTQLRYRPALASEHVLGLATDVEMAMTEGEHRMFGQDTTSTARFSLRVTSVDGDRLGVALTVLAMKLGAYDPSRVGLAEPDLAGSQGTFVMTDRGMLVEVALPFLDEHEAARDEFQLEDYLFALPAEAVGIGAKWDVRLLAQRNGISMEIVETHELVAFDGTLGRTVVTTVMRADPQLVPALAYSALSTFELAGLTSTGSGEVRFALDRPIPIEIGSKFNLTSRMRIRLPEGVQSITMTMAADMKTSVE